MLDLNFLAYNIANDIGLIAFATVGVYKGIHRDLDILGITSLGFFTALGGGITRDVLANRYPAAFLGYNDVSFTFLGIAFAILLYKLTKKDFSQKIVLKISDAIGLAAFGVVGATVGYKSGFNIIGVILLSLSTAVGGGSISDILTNKIPMVLKEDFYATCVIVGAIWFFVTTKYHILSQDSVFYSTFFIILTLRMLAIIKSWHLPKI